MTAHVVEGANHARPLRTFEWIELTAPGPVQQCRGDRGKPVFWCIARRSNKTYRWSSTLQDWELMKDA